MIRPYRPKVACFQITGFGCLGFKTHSVAPQSKPQGTANQLKPYQGKSQTVVTLDLPICPLLRAPMFCQVEVGLGFSSEHLGVLTV